MAVVTDEASTMRLSLLALFVTALGLVSGCTSPIEAPRLPTANTAPKPAESAAGAQTNKQADDKPADKQNDKKINVRPLEVRTASAHRALERNYRGLLKRQPLGFSTRLVDKLRDRIAGLTETVTEFPRKIRQASPLALFGWGLPILIGVLFLGGYFVLTHQIGRLAHRFQAEFHLDLSAWLTRLIRGLVLVTGRTLAIMLLVILSYFPVQAVFGTRPWTLVLTNTLWLLVAYATLGGIAISLFSGRVLSIEEKASRQLERMAINGLRIVFGFLILLQILQSFEVDPETVAFTQFVFRTVLVAFPLALYFTKDSVLHLLPASSDSRAYAVFRSTVVRNYRGWMGATAVLLAMRAAGYLEASSFFLVRGYLLIALIIGLFVVYRATKRYLESRVRPDEENKEEQPKTGFANTGEDRRQLSRRIEQLVSLGLVVVGTTSALQLLWLLEPTLIILRTPFLAIGDVHISLFSFVSLGLIILGTILATALLRALLNAKIYPFFEVDVGVAYAFNTIIKYVLIVLAFVFALMAIGVDLTALTVVAASLGVGIGFGLQTLVENLISGFILLFGRSVEKGDYITVEDTYGQVEAVGARSVIVKTPDNYEMLIPSKEIVGNRIINWSYKDNVVRARLDVGVSYNSEPEEVREVLLDTTERHPDVLDQPSPSVRLEEFGDSAINFELLFFFDCRRSTEEKVVGELNFEVWEGLEEAGITIPFPQRDVHFKSAPPQSEEFSSNRPASSKQSTPDDEPATSEQPPESHED